MEKLASVDKVDFYLRKVLFIVAFLAMLIAAIQFVFSIPFDLYRDISNQIDIFKIKESVDSDGGHIAIVDGKKTIMRPCDPTWYEKDKCTDENGHFKENGFYRDDYADTILNPARH